MGKNNMPSMMTKVEARKTLEHIPEIRSGTVNMRKSSAGYCTDPRSENHGKVWAFLSLQNGDIVQYSGFAGDSLRRQKISLGASDDVDSKRHKFLKLRSSEGFQDLKSNALPMKPWDSTKNATYRGKYSGSSSDDSDDEHPSYRGKKKSKCSKKKKKSCKKSKKCSWKSYKKGSGKKSHCSKKPKKSKKSKKSKKKSKCSKKKMKSCKKSKKCSWKSYKKGSGKKSHCSKKPKKSKKSKKSKK